MPTMVNLFKTVAESLIQVLTLLLQVMIQHIEIAPVVNPTAEAPPESNTQIQAMMEELHSQRMILENFMQQRKMSSQSQGSTANLVSKNLKTKSVASPSMPTDHSGTGANPRMANVGPSHPPMQWCLAESDDDVIVEEEEIEIISAKAPPSSRTAPPVRQQLAQQRSIEEWGSQIVSWGKKHRGKTFDQTLQQDPAYLEWCQKRFMSLTPEMQDLVRYGQLKMSQRAAEASAAEV